MELSSFYRDVTLYKVGDTVRCFDPRTLGVVKEGEVKKVGRKYLTVDFGLTGTTRVHERDLLGHGVRFGD